LPLIAVAVDFRAHLAQEALLKFVDLLDMHAHDEWFGGGDLAVDHEDIVELIVARGSDRRALVDFGGVEQIENRKVLHIQDLVHALEAEAALAVKEIGNVGLLESGQLGQVKPGELAVLDALPQDAAQIILQGFEFHAGSIALDYSDLLLSS